MKFSHLAAAAVVLVSCTPSSCIDAFVPKNLGASRLAKLAFGMSSTASVTEVSTVPIQGMKPGTSGLRKKVEIWQAVDEENKNYVENFIQSLLDTATDANGGKMLETIIVAGDGRYYNAEAMQIICRVLAANGVANVWIPKSGIMSTPAVSAVIRMREEGKCQGGIVLTASHNPGGPGEDFGIKYNEGFGQPAGEEFTDKLYERSLEISSFKTLENTDDIDLNAEVGTSFALTDTSTVTIIDPFEEYVDCLKECFDFDALQNFCQRPDFSILFDGMHGAGGPFAKRVLIEELGMPEVRTMLICFFLKWVCFPSILSPCCVILRMRSHLF